MDVSAITEKVIFWDTCLRKDRVFLLRHIEMNSISSPSTRNLLYSYCCMWGCANVKANPSQYSNSFIMASISVSEYQGYKVLAISREPCTAKEGVWRMYGKGSNKIHWFIASPSQLQQIKLLLLDLKEKLLNGGSHNMTALFLERCCPCCYSFPRLLCGCEPG